MDANTLAEIASQEIQDFIVASEGENEAKLSLKYKKLGDLPFSLIAQQLVGRRKAKQKLPSFYSTRGIIYPPSINLEQCSSEATAKFKAHLIQDSLTNRSHFIDLTSGFGSDSFFISKICKQVTAIEPDQSLLSIAMHNHQQLGARNILLVHKTAEDYLIRHRDSVDLFYVDPSRRSNEGKVVKLSDCEPNIIGLQEKLFQRSDWVLVKTSPLLDIQQGLRELKCVERVVVVSVENECKELLFLQHKTFEGEATIQAINLTHEGSILHNFSFLASQEREFESELGELNDYLYEPNASVLKAGAFKWIAQKFDLKKIQINTHLYTSASLVKNFPGRIFKVEAINPRDKDLHPLLPEGMANVITRNYPLSAEALKKKLRLKDGGEKFVIGFSEQRRKTIVVASKVILHPKADKSAQTAKQSNRTL
jgi:16S rRNA G966 N2-methylase RsmD